MKRGDLVIIADGGGDFSGKPRPALVVQSNLFSETHKSVTVCPLTSIVLDDLWFRVPILPDDETGLREASEIQTDKVQAVRRIKITSIVGQAPPAVMDQVDDALRRWLDL